MRTPPPKDIIKDRSHFNKTGVKLEKTAETFQPMYYYEDDEQGIKLKRLALKNKRAKRKGNKARVTSSSVTSSDDASEEQDDIENLFFKRVKVKSI